MTSPDRLLEEQKAEQDADQLLEPLEQGGNCDLDKLRNLLARQEDPAKLIQYIRGKITDLCKKPQTPISKISPILGIMTEVTKQLSLMKAARTFRCVSTCEFEVPLEEPVSFFKIQAMRTYTMEIKKANKVELRINAIAFTIIMPDPDHKPITAGKSVTDSNRLIKAIDTTQYPPGFKEKKKFEADGRNKKIAMDISVAIPLQPDQALLIAVQEERNLFQVPTIVLSEELKANNYLPLEKLREEIEKLKSALFHMANLVATNQKKENEIPLTTGAKTRKKKPSKGRH